MKRRRGLFWFMVSGRFGPYLINWFPRLEEHEGKALRRKIIQLMAAKKQRVKRETREGSIPKAATLVDTFLQHF